MWLDPDGEKLSNSMHIHSIHILLVIAKLYHLHTHLYTHFLAQKVTLRGLFVFCHPGNRKSCVVYTIRVCTTRVNMRRALFNVENVIKPSRGVAMVGSCLRSVKLYSNTVKQDGMVEAQTQSEHNIAYTIWHTAWYVCWCDDDDGPVVCGVD